MKSQFNLQTLREPPKIVACNLNIDFRPALWVASSFALSKYLQLRLKKPKTEMEKDEEKEKKTVG